MNKYKKVSYLISMFEPPPSRGGGHSCSSSSCWSMEEKLSLFGKPLQHVFALFPSNGLLRIGYSLQGVEKEQDRPQR